LPVGKDTLHACLGHLEDAYLVFPVTIHTRSERARMVNPRKIYLVDPGLAVAFSYEAERDVGHRLENSVYLELRRRGHLVEYLITSSGREVDFLARSLEGQRLLIQVCARLTEPSTRRQELRALDEALEEQRLDHALLVTIDELGEERLEHGTVRIVPAWRWLAEG